MKGSRSSFAFLDLPKRPRKERLCCCTGEQKCDDDDEDADEVDGALADADAAATKWVTPLRLPDLVSMDPAEEVRLIGALSGSYQLDARSIDDEEIWTMIDD